MLQFVRRAGGLHLLVLLAAICWHSEIHAQGSRRPAGYVTAIDVQEVDGAPGAILRREGQEIDLQIWTSLFAGDVLEVRGKNSVTIETVKDRRLTVDAAKSPHRIEGALSSAGQASEFASVIGDLFRARPSRPAVNLVGRAGEAPVLRMAGAKTQYVVSGARLWLKWQGGAPPYTVEIRGQSMKRSLDIRVLQSVTTGTPETFIRVPETASGNLKLVIRDGEGREAMQHLETTGPVEFPAWISNGSPSDEYTRVARALHLLRRADRTYDLTAAAMAAEVADYPAAAALLAGLAEGRRPK